MFVVPIDATFPLAVSPTPALYVEPSAAQQELYDSGVLSSSGGGGDNVYVEAGSLYCEPSKQQQQLYDRATSHTIAASSAPPSASEAETYADFTGDFTDI
jgi:hypothetical protein